MVKFLVGKGADVHQRATGRFFMPEDQKFGRKKTTNYIGKQKAFNVNHPKWKLHVVKVSYGHQSRVADGHLGQVQVTNARSVSHIGLGSNLPTQSHMADSISLTIYILKFKFRAQIMNFTVVDQGHASCSHHVHTLYAHAVSFSITHLLHNAHCTRTLPFAPFCMC